MFMQMHGGGGGLTIRNAFTVFINKLFSTERKHRTDAGSSVFNCHKKRKHAFTEYNKLKKRKYTLFREDPYHIPEEELKQESKRLPVAEME